MGFKQPQTALPIIEDSQNNAKGLHQDCCGFISKGIYLIAIIANWIPEKGQAYEHLLTLWNSMKPMVGTLSPEVLDDADDRGVTL